MKEMFMEERRGSLGRWFGCATVLQWSVLVAIWMDASREDVAAEEAASGVVIATDAEEPAGFVPHEEALLAPELDLEESVAETPADDDVAESPAPERPTDHAAKPSLAQPSSIGSSREQDPPSALRESNPFRTFSDAPAPEEVEEVKEWIHAAHELAKEAASTSEYAAVIELCQQGQESTRWPAGRNYFRTLAAWAFNRRGEEHIREGADAAALKDFEQAVQLDPRNWRAAHNRAVSYAQQGNLDRALTGFGHVLRLRPDYGPAYRNRGEVHFGLGQYSEAIEDYTRAIEHMSSTDELLYLRAHAHFHLDHLEEALSDYSSSLQASATPERLVGRAAVHALREDYASAIADLNRAIKTDPGYAEAYRAVAWLLATCPDAAYRRPEKALLAARHALKLQGNNDPVYYDTLAAAYAATGDFDQAQAVQQRAVQLAAGQAGEQAMQVRLALYNQNRSLVSEPGEPERPSPQPRRSRAAGPSGLRQPLRLGSR